MDAGMNIVRLNFSHGSHEFHATTVTNCKDVRQEKNRICAVLLDTKGPEIRTGNVNPATYPNGEFRLKKGDTVVVEAGAEAMKKDVTHQRIVIDYASMGKSLHPGSRILIDDGLLGLEVQSVDTEANSCVCKVLNSANLSSKKGVNLPGVKVDLPAMSEKDKEDLRFASKHWVDFIAASFIRKAEDVVHIREFITQDAAHHGRGIKIIAKIENQEGLDNFDEILAVADGIMVARGDLGVEIPLERVALAQKMMIAKCLKAGKMVVTATQMLETMHTQPFPTRAEATDVANAVFDGTDCVMLSGETAKGMYPIEACSRMAKICQAAESVFDNEMIFDYLHGLARTAVLSTDEAVVLSAVKVANSLKASLIVTYTNSGHTARLVAKYRPSALVFAMTPFDRTARQLLGIRGVFPFIIRPDDASSLPTPTTGGGEGEFDMSAQFGAAGSALGAQAVGTESEDALTRAGVDFEAVLFESMSMARARGLVRVGDFVVVVRSWSSDKNANTNVLRILTVPSPQVSFDAI